MHRNYPNSYRKLLLHMPHISEIDHSRVRYLVLPPTKEDTGQNQMYHTSENSDWLSGSSLKDQAFREKCYQRQMKEYLSGLMKGHAWSNTTVKTHEK
jgi:hypothetical protein